MRSISARLIKQTEVIGNWHQHESVLYYNNQCTIQSILQQVSSFHKQTASLIQVIINSIFSFHFILGDFSVHYLDLLKIGNNIQRAIFLVGFVCLFVPLNEHKMYANKRLNSIFKIKEESYVSRDARLVLHILLQRLRIKRF